MNVRSALLAGFIASTIWMFIATAVDLGKSMVLIGGIVCLVGTAVITAIVASVIARSKSPA